MRSLSCRAVSLWVLYLAAVPVLALGISLLALIRTTPICPRESIHLSEAAAERASDSLGRPLFEDDNQETLVFTEEELSSYASDIAADSGMIEVQVFLRDQSVCLVARPARLPTALVGIELSVELGVARDGTLIASARGARIGLFTVPADILAYSTRMLDDLIARFLWEIQVQDLQLDQGHLMLRVRPAPEACRENDT